MRRSLPTSSSADVAKYLGIQPLTTIPEVSLGSFSDDRDDDKKKPFHWAGK